MTRRKDLETFKLRNQTWSMEEIQEMVFDSVVESTECEYCGHSWSVEPDASNYKCNECGKGSVSSPLVALGFM